MQFRLFVWTRKCLFERLDTLTSPFSFYLSFFLSFLHYSFNFIAFAAAVFVVAVGYFSPPFRYYFALYTLTATLSFEKQKWSKREKMISLPICDLVVLLLLLWLFSQWNPLDVKSCERLHGETETKWNQMSWYVKF